MSVDRVGGNKRVAVLSWGTTASEWQFGPALHAHAGPAGALLLRPMLFLWGITGSVTYGVPVNVGVLSHRCDFICKHKHMINILASSDEHPKTLDFGCACIG